MTDRPRRPHRGGPAARPGTYALALLASGPRRIAVGRLGRVSFDAGVYLYVGSARGPGGLGARLRHHLRVAALPRWHLDHLRRIAAPLSAFVTYGSRRRECLWARRVAALPGFERCVPGFGSSDCGCDGHLFFAGSVRRFARRAGRLRERLRAVDTLDRSDLAALAGGRAGASPRRSRRWTQGSRGRPLPLGSGASKITAAMSRVTLIHWNVSEAEERAERLRRAGHETEVLAPRGGAGRRVLWEHPPAAFVIDLGRLPAQGRDLGVLLRQRQASRLVPIVFVDGDPDKVARVREVLPDAAYTGWSRIRGALRRAIASPPADPVVPGSMDAYSGAPLTRKLGIRAGSVVALLGAPAGFERQLGALPEKVHVRRRARGGADVILLFARSRADLERRFAAAARALAARGGLWIVWPKKASGVATDLTQSLVRAFGLGAGFVDYKICAVDATWSGLLFARRRARRGAGRS